MPVKRKATATKKTTKTRAPKASHLVRGSAAAKAWGARMRALRKK